MTIEQQIIHEAIQKVCHQHITLSVPRCYSLKITNYEIREEIKKDFLYIWLLQCITLYKSR